MQGGAEGGVGGGVVGGEGDEGRLRHAPPLQRPHDRAHAAIEPRQGQTVIMVPLSRGARGSRRAVAATLRWAPGARGIRTARSPRRQTARGAIS